MKIMAFNEARSALKQAVEDSQSGGVVITVHGKPAAVLVGVRGQSFEDLYLRSEEFWSTLAARQAAPRRMSSLGDVQRRLAPAARKVRRQRGVKPSRT